MIAKICEFCGNKPEAKSKIKRYIKSLGGNEKSLISA